MVITADEACSLLNKENPRYETLAWTFHHMSNENRLAVVRKGDDVLEAVQRMKEQRMFPIVDKTLRLVLGVTSHLYLMTELFRYHYHADDPKEEKQHIGPHESADRFVTDGYGYFISSLSPETIVVGEIYRPDGLDKVLFSAHSLDILTALNTNIYGMSRLFR